MGSPVCHIDYDSHSIIAASMISRPKSAPSMSNSSGPFSHDHEILFYCPPDWTNPIARCGSDVWEKDKKTHPEPQPWFHPFTRDMLQVAQIVDIKHYPRIMEKGKIRVIIVIAFGQRAHPTINTPTANSQSLKVWSMLKVIELWVPADPIAILSQKTSNQYSTFSVEIEQVRDCVRINPSDVINYESIEPRQKQIRMNGGIVKLYSAQELSRHSKTAIGRAQESVHMDVDTKTVDCIAIFGTQKSDTASAMIIKKVLFRDGDENSSLAKKTYSNKALSQEVSRMTLFPDRSGYEHLLVLFNLQGIAMIWDWINDRQIPQLRMHLDDKCAQRAEAALKLRGFNYCNNPVSNNSALSAHFPHRRVHYWGVQVSSTLEVDFLDHLNTNNMTSANTNDKSKYGGMFRILTIADGEEQERESYWWNITGDDRNGPSAARGALPTGPGDRTVPTSPFKIDLGIPKSHFAQPATAPFTGGTFHTDPSFNTNSFNVPFGQPASTSSFGRSNIGPW
ncbi:hypothetical protein BGW39_001385 [Mortierella sp. 14UC]|nr:hypothetical protein BGW39_001385 [Mortierella sp. 14UC]